MAREWSNGDPSWFFGYKESKAIDNYGDQTLRRQRRNSGSLIWRRASGAKSRVALCSIMRFGAVAGAQRKFSFRTEVARRLYKQPAVHRSRKAHNLTEIT